MGVVRFAAIVAALGLLGWGMVSGVAASRADAQREVDTTARADVTERARTLDEYFSRARSVLLLAAQNPSFRDFYQLPGPTEQRLRDGGEALNDVLAQMRYLHSLYPDSIGEICFIDRHGAENARLVRGITAPVSDLSADERGNGFFAPTLAVPVGEVLQAAPYVSPDTGDWVISNSTPLVGRDGAITAMLHYEVSLESFRQLIVHAGGEHRVRVVDVVSGDVVADTAASQAASSSQVADPTWRTALPTTNEGVAEVGGRRIAYQHVSTSRFNENHWVVLMDLPVATANLGGVATGRTLGLAGLAFAILLLALLGARARRLRIVADTDLLTGIANRRSFAREADHALAQARRNGSFVAVAIADLDRFKVVNDTLGHQAGDDLLRLVATRISTAVGPNDLVARIGGDEFALLFADLESPDAGIVCARHVAEALRESFKVNDVTFSVEASIGVSIGEIHGDCVEPLLQSADVAMYAAKRQHLGVVVFATDLEVHRPEQLALLGDLRNAIRDGDLQVHFQPKVALDTGRTVGFEALVRWNHPTLGDVPPAEFVELAECSSLIRPLTQFVLDRALEQCGRWRDAGRQLSVAVNISARSLHDGDFSERVLSSIARWGVDPSLVVLELTESAIMTDPDRARTTLIGLHAAGVQISIDDFGTGYSSLAYLQSLPIDELKIDRGFVAQLDDRCGSVIVRAVIDLARNLGLRVVAEGIESERTVAHLRALGCDVGQGFTWSQAMPAEALDPWLDSRAQDRSARYANALTVA
jgi:diguanylate cyclase (GGDEF)-like protein